MRTDDVVQEAIEELYSIDPDDFMARRTALAATARKTDQAAAKDIAALRKPTRSAYVLNRLVRSDSEAAQRLSDLGGELLAAQDALDGPRMRELSTVRRGLVEELANQAFQLTGQPSPPPALRDEVVSTLNAAVADEGVVEQLRTGTLLRSARWDGFGFASPPELSVVRPTAPRRARGDPATQPKPKAGTRGTAGGPARGTATASKAKPARATKTSADRRAAETAARSEAKAEARAAEQRRREALAQARRAVKDADAGLAKTIKAEDEQQTRVRLLHEQLTDARRRLDEIRIDVRRAENRQRKAQQALERQEK
ncbi:MAG: hypothetical protein ACR2J5_12090 [Geodermatophilaceae bacterium]